MKFEPRPYQKDIIQFIIENERCAIWAGMGLGKTAATLSAIANLKLLDPAHVLIVAPKRVCIHTWPDEIKKWENLSHMTCSVIAGTPKQRREALLSPADIHTINYENIVWLVNELKGDWPFATVVCDESTKLKSFRLKQGGVRTRALGKLAYTKIDRFIELTGTPSPKGMEDLWGQAWFLDKGERLERSFTAFQRKYFYPKYSTTAFTAWEIRDGAQKEIQDKLSDICLSIEAKDHFDLLKPIVNVIKVTLPPSAALSYKHMEKEFFAEINGHEIDAISAASLSQKLLQLCNGAIYINEKGGYTPLHDEKLDALEEVMEEASGAPVLVAYNFKSDLARIRKRFPYARTFSDGGNVLGDWNAGKIRMLVAHPASAGHGLNMQYGGNILVYFGINWNFELHAQILERIGPTRQLQSGLNRSVFVHYIVADNTIDLDVMERLLEKKSVQEVLMNAMKRHAGT